MRVIPKSSHLTLGMLLFCGALEADTIFVTNPGNNSVEQFDANGNGSVFVSGGLLSYPQGIAMDSSGNIYVANQVANTIVKYDSARQGSVFVNSGLDQPMGLAFDAAGYLYVANAGANTVSRFDASGHGGVFASTGVNNPIGLAFDSHGYLYVANTWAGTVMKLDGSGNGSLFASFGSTQPYGVVVDRNDNVYIGTVTDQTIWKFAPGGGQVAFNVGINNPEGLAFDSSGVLYVAEFWENAVVTVDANGQASPFANTGLSNPSFILVVPEPSLCSLVGVGAVLVLSDKRLFRRFQVIPDGTSDGRIPYRTESACGACPI